MKVLWLNRLSNIGLYQQEKNDSMLQCVARIVELAQTRHSLLITNQESNKYVLNYKMCLLQKDFDSTIASNMSFLSQLSFDELMAYDCLDNFKIVDDLVVADIDIHLLLKRRRVDLDQRLQSLMNNYI